MSSLRRVLVVTGAIGFATGMLLAPSWQDVIEPAQVLAGVVTYPAGNPVGLYSTQTWTLLHQVPALLLGLGVPERALALILSGVTGMVSFQALGVTALAVGGDVVLACVLPFFAYSVQATAGGVGYPVFLLGWPYTSGSIGLSMLLLSLALLGAGTVRIGLLLLGLLPAVHVTLGAWGLIVAATAALGGESGQAMRAGQARQARQRLTANVSASLARPALWLVAGLFVTIGSALVHQALFRSPGPGVTDAEAEQYLVAVMTFWDNHRRPFTRLSIGAAPFFICVLASGLWLRRFRNDLPAAARYLLRALLVAAAFGFLLSVVLAVSPSVFRFWLWRAMPSRLMNLALLACMPVVAGLAARSGHHIVNAAMVVVLTLVLTIDSSVVGFASSYAMLAAVVALAYIRSRSGEVRLKPDATYSNVGSGFSRNIGNWLHSNVGSGFSRNIAVAVALLLMGVLALRATPGFAARLNAVADRTNNPFFAAVEARPGVLLTASDLHLVQLRTRRPVLVDGGALDALAYIPDAAPETARILQRVYGVDLLAPGFPPREAQGALPRDAGRELWLKRTVDEWRTIGAEFGVTDVLAFEDWPLQLPEIARGEGLLLYAIPPP